MQRYLIVAAVSLSLIPLASISQDAKANKAGDNAKPAQTTSPPIPPKQTDGDSLEGEGSDYKLRDEPIKVVVMDGPAKDTYDKVVFWANLVLVGVGIGGVIVGVCTVLFVKGQVIEMRRQRITMERTLISMRKQITLGEDTAKRQLRAYITIRNGRIYIGKDGSVKVTIEFTNGGQTPAYGLRAELGAQGISAYPVQIRPVAPTVAGGPQSVLIAGAGSRFSTSSTANGWNAQNSGAIISSIRAGNLVYFANGEITYTDVFKEHRFLRYQLVLGRDNAATLESDEGKSFYVMTTDSVGNDAD